MSKSEILTICAPAESGDLAAGLAYLEASYQKAFGLSPSPPDHLLVARRGDRVVGTFGVNCWHPDRGLRLAQLYRFDHARSPLPIDLCKTVEFGKWACDTSDVSALLVHAAICFSLSHQMTHVWCEHTESVNRSSRRFGIVFYEVLDTCLDRSKIEPYHQAFYDKNDAHLYMFELGQAKEALEAFLRKK